MHNFPRLVSDVGGTNARFAVEVAPYVYEQPKTLQCRDYASLSSAILAYLDSVGYSNKVKHGALAVPSPIVDDNLFMVNSPWHMSSISKTKQEIDFDTLIFLNDFHALALSIPHLPEDQLVKVCGTEANPTKPISIIGPGTALGMATLFKHPLNDDYFAIPAEGGRSSFVPFSDEEFNLWKFVHKRYNHVSAERLLSGPGLQLMYEALCSINNVQITRMPTPAEITEMGVNNKCYISRQTINHFCRILATISSNLTCMTSAFGGVYIGGGIIPRIINYFLESDFRCRFVDKGRFRSFLAKVPVYVIMHDYPAMLGSSYALETYLSKHYIP